MIVEIKPYSEEWVPAVREFNTRMKPGREHFEVSTLETTPVAFPKIDGRKFYQERFFVTDGAHVRGGYTINWQEVSFRGEIVPVASLVRPISEGVVDRHFLMVGIDVVRDALQRSSLLYGLGGGGYDRPLVVLLRAMGWSMRSVPSYFKIKNATRFLRNLGPLRKRRLGSVIMDASALSGVGPVAVWVSDAILGMKHRLARLPSVEAVAEFADWADEVWEASYPRYSMIAVRDRQVLNLLYPPDRPQYTRLKVAMDERLLGWAVVSETEELQAHFGNMRVGRIMDCLARPEDAGQVMRAATRVLEERGVDLIVSNQSHPAWRAALRDAGFVRGPSDCIFATSRLLAEKLASVDPEWTEIHVNRDGRPR